MNFDCVIHSSFLIHWIGKDIDDLHGKKWYEKDKSETNKDASRLYIKRLHDILKYGLWMTKENELRFSEIVIPTIPKTCFTELKISESRKHAKQYGRLGIGVKRPFVFDRLGMPLIYFHEKKLNKDKFLITCSKELNDKKLLNFFKPMNSSEILNFDLYSESEWRIFFKELLSKKLIINPRNQKNTGECSYFCSLPDKDKAELKYLIPLSGWFAMIIYPSLKVKNSAQQDESNGTTDLGCYV